MSYCIKVHGTSQACHLLVLLRTNRADGANKIEPLLAQDRLASDIHMASTSAGRAAIFSSNVCRAILQHLEHPSSILFGFVQVSAAHPRPTA